tara:strand:+ start:4139 stop:4822 length:684 start_codon:yes stop_codon:yes gene_type:complete
MPKKNVKNIIDPTPFDMIDIKKKDQKDKPQKRSKGFELRRQLFHILFGIVLVVLIEVGVLNSIGISILIIIGFIISLRARKAYVPIISWFLKRFERKENMRGLPGKGVLFYLVGALIVLLIFPKDIALASIMVLALGDAVSHLWGSHFGRIRNPFADKKFIEGTLSGFAVGFLGALIYVGPIEAAVASLAAMVAEAIEVTIGTEAVDDNLVVPFIAALAIWLVRIAI